MITKDMTIYEALLQKPECGEIFGEFGMHCLHCPISRGETIEQAAASHGIELNKLIEALNK